MSPLFSATDTKWVIAAEKFSSAKGQKETSVSKSLSENLPSGILEKLGDSQFRNVQPSEQLERKRYKLRQDRISLYLQLSSAYQKRDAVFLNDYSKSKLKKKIKEEEKKIKTIEKSLEDNLKSLKEAEDETAKKIETLSNKKENRQDEENEFSKFSGLLRKIFREDESLISLEQISLYRDDVNSLYQPTEKALESGYESAGFAKAAYSAGINTLITGSFSIYGDYISVALNLYLYPEARKIGSVMEVGNIQDLELLTTSLAGQLIPLLTNALPAQLSIYVEPAHLQSKCQIYIDDVLQTASMSEIILESGRHTIQVALDGYESSSFTEYYDGNAKYRIDVTLKPKTDGAIQVGLIKPLEGNLYINGETVPLFSPQKYIVQLNGSHALGEFIDANEQTAFFYIPQKLLKNGNKVKIKPKTRDRASYIDKRRKWMYGAYSLFMVSLIPSFYTHGTFENKLKLYNDYDTVTYEEALQWENAANTCTAISITCGVLWGIELVRYFIAANSVLPQNARSGDIIEVIMPELQETQNTQETQETPAETEKIENE